MSRSISTPYLTFKTHPIQNMRTELLSDDLPLAQDVAQPLFEAGVEQVGIFEHRVYRSGSGARGRHDLSLVLQGEMHVEMNGEKYIAKPGDLVVCPAGTHLFRYAGRSGVRDLYFRILDVPAWAPFKTRPPYMRPCESADLAFVLVRGILDGMRTHHPVDVARARDNSRALVNLLKHEMIRPNLDHTEQSISLQRLAEEIKHAPAKRWDRQAMAKVLNLTVSQMTRFLRNDLGVSPKELVIRQRMMKATELLTNTPWKIESIAEELGYTSLYSFTRLFTQHIGMPPGKYRARFAPSGQASS